MIGVGVIGVGDVSDVYLTNLQRFSGLQLVACGGGRPEAAGGKARAYSIEALSVDAMLARDDIGLVVNLTPPAAHIAIGHRILEAGKHLYSEKPLATDTASGNRLLALAASMGLRVGCAPDTFLGAGGRLARRVIDEGRIGRVLSGTCFFMSHGMEHRHPNPGFFFQPGGGPLLDIGPYYLTTLVNLLGPIRHVQARASTGFAERLVTAPGPMANRHVPVDTPTTVMAILGFESGCDVTMTMSWDVWRHDHPAIELYGTEGSIQVPDPDAFGGDILLAEGRGEWQRLESANLAFGARNWRHPSWDEARPMTANYRGVGVAEMAASILNGTSHRASGELACHVLEVMEAALYSATHKNAVELTPILARPEAWAEEDVTPLSQSSRLDAPVSTSGGTGQ